MSWYTLVTLAHIIGTALGVGGATFAEIFFLKSIRDGEINPEEGAFLKLTFFVMRIGMALLVVSGFGFLYLYRVTGETELLYSPKLWAKLTIILILLFGVVAWHAKRAPMWIGSAVSLTAWYTALVLGAWRRLDASYFTIMISFVIAVVVVAAVLALVRKRLGIKL